MQPNIFQLIYLWGNTLKGHNKNWRLTEEIIADIFCADAVLRRNRTQLKYRCWSPQKITYYST